MATKVISRKWITMALTVGLIALLSVVNVQALEAVEAPPRLVSGFAPLAVHCELDLFGGADPFASPAEIAEPCPEIVVSEMRSVEFAGDTAWVEVVVDGELELHVYLNRDGMWERIPYSSGPSPEWEYLYMLEDENVGLALGSPQLQPAPEMGDGAAPPTLPEAVTADISVDPRGENYWNEWLALQQGAAMANISGDPRGNNYWDEWLARQQGASLAAPSRVTDSLSGADLIALAEREIDSFSGSRLNTLADLVLALFGGGWAQNSAVEDLAREFE